MTKEPLKELVYEKPSGVEKVMLGGVNLEDLVTALNHFARDYNERRVPIAICFICGLKGCSGHPDNERKGEKKTWQHPSTRAYLEFVSQPQGEDTTTLPI